MSHSPVKVLVHSKSNPSDTWNDGLKLLYKQSDDEEMAECKRYANLDEFYECEFKNVSFLNTFEKLSFIDSEPF